MIDIKDLMIGDFLRYKRNFPDTHLQGKIVKVCGVRGRVDVRTIDDGNFHESVHPDWLEPIPLTPEILEKNGFKSWEHGYMWKERIGMGGQTTSASSPIEIIIYEGGHSVIMNPHDGKEFQGSIDNVHQLQHALRLCGINLQIEL